MPKQSIRMLKQTIGHLYLGGKGKNKFWVGHVNALIMINSEKVFEFIAAYKGFYSFSRNLETNPSGKIGLVIWT